jgi:hypothetical protein
LCGAAATGALGVLLLALTGCPPPAGQAPSSRREAIERVNGNLENIQEPLQCPAFVSFRFRDDEGKEHAFFGHEARLIYQPPQALLFDVLTLTGTIARFGSDATHYWVWLDAPDLRKLWWGRWDRVQRGDERKLPIPPNELFDALMLRPLPESLEGGQLPLLRVVGDDHRLIFVRLGAGGQPLGWRELRLDPRPPHMPLEVIDRSPEGAVDMHAELASYQRIGADGPYTPRRYVVRWPDAAGQPRAELRLDIVGAKFRPALPVEQFELPTGWQGPVEQIDAPADGGREP